MICMGDLHLSHLIWFKHKAIVDDALVAFTELVEQAIEMAVPLVLVGDLYDTVTPPSDIVQFVRHHMDRLATAKIPVYFIDGNHDKRPMPWSEAISDWPIHIGHGQLVEINGVSVRGFDYALSPDIQASLAGLVDQPLPQVLFLHQAVRQGLGFENAWNCDLDWVPNGIPLVVMGDIHKPAQYRLRDNGTALYTGSTHPRDTGEIGPKSFVVINEDLTWTRVPFARQRLFFHHVFPDSFEIDVHQLMTSVAQYAGTRQWQPPVLWVNHSAGQASAMDLVTAQLATEMPGAIVIREQRTFTTGTSIETDVDTSDVPTIPQLVDRVVDPVTEPFAHGLVKALTDPKCNPQEVIAAYRAQFLAQAS